VSARSEKFSPDWLAARLAALPVAGDVPQQNSLHAEFAAEVRRGALTARASGAAASYCVALSGGLDSVVLLAALVAATSYKRVRAVHINHGLHPNAPKWAAHCRRVAKRLGVPLTVLSAKIDLSGGVSLEAAARVARYDLLAHNLDAGEVLLTAHHEDDQLETVFLQLLRGAGLAGLAAMPEVTAFAGGLHVRPLLSRSRDELESWARTRELTWVDDDTNTDPRFDRNYLRHQVLPLIRARWPGAAHAVSRSARHAAEAQRLLDAIARKDVERAADGAGLSAKALRALNIDRRRNALRFWITRSGARAPDTKRLNEMANALLDARVDSHPFVDWNGMRVQRSRDVLFLEPAKARAAPSDTSSAVFTSWCWQTESLHRLSGDAGHLELVRAPDGPLDLDLLPATLRIRARRGGERLRPRRGGPTRTLKFLLQESRLPVAVRSCIPLVFHEDKLLAAGEEWLDASIQATVSSQHRARLCWRR